MDIRQVVEPFVAGQIRTFTCPPANDTGFLCDGTLADGGTFQVFARLAPDQIANVSGVLYGREHPSAFFNAVRDYVKPDAPLQSVRCELLPGSKPDLFSCDAIDAKGVTTILNVGRPAGGPMRIYGIVVPVNSRPPTPRWIPYAAGGVILLGVLMLALALVQIFRLRRRLVVATLPLIAEQRVSFPAAGDYILNAEGPQFSMLFMGLQYSLADAATGTPVSSFPTIMRAHTSSFTRARIALRRFFVPREGEYVLRVSGMRPDRDASRGRIVFSKAWPPLAYLWIALALGGGGCMFVGLLSLVVALG
jgi:hypothetical protein